MTASKRRPQVPPYQPCPRCRPARTAKRYSWERDLKPKIADRRFIFTCKKCKLPIRIGPDGFLVKPKKKSVSERISRTASNSFSRRELARRRQEPDATVRLVTSDQIPSSVEAEVRQESICDGSSIADAVKAHEAVCAGDDTADSYADETQAEKADLELEKQIAWKLDSAIKKHVVLEERFRLEKQIGAGCNGRVILAFDEKTERQVAVKVHFNTLGDSDSADEERKRVGRAFELQGKVLSPYCVQTIALLVTEFGHVLVEEFADGQNLDDVVSENGPLSELEAIHIGLQMCSVLQAAHTVLQIVHRDIKPANIVMVSDGTIKLIDWGCSRSNSKDKRDTSGISLEDIEELDIDTVIDTITLAGLVIGTPNYMASEQVDGQRVTIQSDLCSLGATLFFLVTGQKPFTGTNLGLLLKSVLFDPPPNPNDLLPKGAPKLTKRFCKVLAKAMEKKPENRYATPEEMKQALEACLSTKVKTDQKATGLFASIRNWFKSR